MLDLKSELYSLKNKLLQQDQKRNSEVTQKNIQISSLEKKFKEEQALRLQENSKKQKASPNLAQE